MKRSNTVEEKLSIPKGLQDLCGEFSKGTHQATYHCPYSGNKNGTLYLTNYRLYFQTTDSLLQKLDIPLGVISRIKKILIYKKDVKFYIVDVVCKYMRKLRFEFEDNLTVKVFLEKLTRSTFTNNFGLKCFAFSYSENFFGDGWNIYDPHFEFKRLGLDKNEKWRKTCVNRNFNLCDTYPSILFIPGLKDNELYSVASFRSRNRLPVLSWIHPKNSSTITRCSQPLTGVSGNRSAEDERYINVIRCTHSFSHRLTIVDARPLANAIANKAKGGGYEASNAYPNVEVIFLNIQNIHVMRESYKNLKKICFSPPSQIKLELSIKNTLWLKHLETLLAGAILIVDRIEEENSVIVHCSDGWDRTSQLTSLAMLILDPYYRTIKGFEILIEKEWLSFGHKFQQRIGHCDMNHSDQERSPIFIQFIDCVWQILRQFPTAMEFNENFLLTILEHLYSCRFGTFLGNTESQREKEIKGQTVSLWSYINSSLRFYKNVSYEPQTNIKPSSNAVLWSKYYFQWNPKINRVSDSYPKICEFRNLQNQFRKQFDKVVESIARKGCNQESINSKNSVSYSKKYY